MVIDANVCEQLAQSQYVARSQTHNLIKSQYNTWQEKPLLFHLFRESKTPSNSITSETQIIH